MQTIEQRLSVLERSARRWRTACVGLVVAGVSVVGIAAAPAKKPPRVQEVITTKRIEVVDENGKPRVILQGSERGGSIWIWGEGNVMGGVQIAADENGGMIRTRDKKGKQIWAAGNK